MHIYVYVRTCNTICIMFPDVGSVIGHEAPWFRPPSKERSDSLHAATRDSRVAEEVEASRDNQEHQEEQNVSRGL